VTQEAFGAINATLNGSSAVLLIAGYIFALRKQFRAHGSLMVAALITSAVFLGSYLYAHSIYPERSSGIGPGPLRTSYRVLLFSHILLAVGMLPPIAMTVWRAYSRQWISHRKLARPTLWIWLYVSITGVIVYFMLYHLFPSMQARN
jgi:uncharacterized membrane protein YozB (DUF420 family)